MSCCQKKFPFCPCSSSWVRFWLCSCALANSEALVAINCCQGEMLYEKLRSSLIFFFSIPLSPHAGMVSLEILEHHANKAPCAKKGFLGINISNATGHWNYGLQALKMTICDWYVVSTERTYSSPLSFSLSQAVLSAVCADWKSSWGRCARRPRPLETRSWRISLQRVGYAVDSWCDSFS